jgi:hypothetical protein
MAYLHVPACLIGFLVEKASQIGHRIFLHGQAIDEVLVVYADSQLGVTPDLALRRLQLLRYQLDDGTTYTTTEISGRYYYLP